MKKFERVELGHYELSEKAEEVYNNTDEEVFKDLDSGLYAVKLLGDIVTKDLSLKELEEYFEDLYDSRTS